jgi:hypothetical protein
MLDSISWDHITLWIETHLFLVRTMVLFCTELMILERSDKVAQIKKERALLTKGHIRRQNLGERVCCLVAERAGEISGTATFPQY